MPLNSVPIALLLIFAAAPAVAFDTSKLGQAGTLPLDDLTALIGRTAS